MNFQDNVTIPVFLSMSLTDWLVFHNKNVEVFQEKPDIYFLDWGWFSTSGMLIVVNGEVLHEMHCMTHSIKVWGTSILFLKFFWFIQLFTKLRLKQGCIFEYYQVIKKLQQAALERAGPAWSPCSNTKVFNSLSPLSVHVNFWWIRIGMCVHLVLSTWFNASLNWSLKNWRNLVFM